MFWTSTIRELQAKHEQVTAQLQECRRRLAALRPQLRGEVGFELTAAKARLAALLARASTEAAIFGRRVDADLASNLAAAHTLLAAEPKPRVAGWRDSWQDWRPGAPCEDELIRVGEREECGIITPVSIPFIGCGRATVIRCDGRTSDVAAGLLQAVMIRTALLLPHRVVYTLLDPAGNGRAFPMRKHLLPGQVRTSAHEVRRDLESVVTDIREIYEKHLDAQTTSFEQIPASIRVNLKYQIVCAADFPNQYTSQDVELLQRIAANGPRAGVYLVLHHNREHALPRETTMDGFKNVHVLDVNSPGCALDLAPEPSLQRRLLEVVAAHKPAPPKDDWESICGLDPAEWWSGNSKHMIETPIGLNANGSRLDFWFGYDTREGRHCVHGIMAGTTGSGKSTLFRNLITGLAMRYSPDELRLYLVDGKRGAGFHRFKDLPHVEVVSLDTEKQPELARSILSELIEEMRRRNEVIGERCGKEELWQYRELGQPHGPLPRILVLVDEYEVLVKGDTGQASEWLRELAKQGRSYGIHMLLSAHLFRMRELTGRDEILAQAHLRAALPLGPQEIEEALEFQREGRARIAGWCQSPGQIVVNSQNGTDGANREGKVSFLEGDRCVEIVSMIRRKANATPGGRGSWKAVVFNGTDQPRLLENRQLVSLLSIPHWPDLGDRRGRILAETEAGTVNGSNAPPRRTTIWPPRSARPPSLTAPAVGTCSESGRSGLSLPRLLYTAAGRSDTALSRSAGFKVPIKAGPSPYCPDSSPMRPNIISGWRAKYSFTCKGPSTVSTERSSVQLSPGAVSGDRFWRNRISVVTTVPAFALNVVLGSRIAPSRIDPSARWRRTVESCLSIV
jgi:DNA segregation ATPase FtsK/SpoIIIE, S-DNA-T family